MTGNARRVSVFGATGSVGRSTLDLLGRDPDLYQVVALAGGRDAAGLAEAARAHRAEVAVIADERALPELRERLVGSGIEAVGGRSALIEAAHRPVDWAMGAISGAAGLEPAMAVVRGGATLAIANKEALVCAGALVRAAADKSGSQLLPVDSEHSAVFQCFDHLRPERVAKVTLTASGGPFRQASLEDMRGVTPEQAVAHPVWSMGAKISVDSATMMNKGLELIEAYCLFPIEADQLDVVIHPQSVVHSLVEYVDGSVLAQLGTPDMRTPIAVALAWPDRIDAPCDRLDLARVGRLDFEAPDLTRFPALALAWQALREGGSRPLVLNAANEVAVDAFLKRSIGFLDIAAIVADTLGSLAASAPDSIDAVMALDEEARDVARAIIARGRRGVA